MKKESAIEEEEKRERRWNERKRKREWRNKKRVRGRRVDDFTTCRLIRYTGSLSAVLCLCGSGRFDISGAFNSGTGNRWR